MTNTFSTLLRRRAEQATEKDHRTQFTRCDREFSVFPVVAGSNRVEFGFVL